MTLIFNPENKKSSIRNTRKNTYEKLDTARIVRDVLNSGRSGIWLCYVTLMFIKAPFVVLETRPTTAMLNE